MRIRTVVGRVPVTIALVLVVLVVGVVGRGLWESTTAQPWWDAVAYGLPRDAKANVGILANAPAEAAVTP